MRAINQLNGYIIVYGTLIARDVTFTGVGNVIVDPTNPRRCSGKERTVPGTWGPIYLDDPDPGSILENCRITYGGRSEGTINMTDVKKGNLTISNCIIANGASDGIRIGGSPNIINTTIQNHKGVGIREESKESDPVVDGCVLLGNGDATNIHSKYPIVAFADNIKNCTNVFITQNILDAIWVWGEPITSATWQDHRVPYHVGLTIASSDVIIRDGETLRLEPGVKINFGVSCGFDVLGTLIADGDSCKHIIFNRIDTSSTEKNWSSISFNGSDPGTILDYCDISFGGASGRPTIDINDVNTNVLISNCRVTHSSNIGINITNNSAPFILNNLISENSLQGIRIATLPEFTPILRNNLIENNFEGVSLNSKGATLDLGTAANPGHNAFVNNLNHELVNFSNDTIFAINNYWVDIDSAVIDTVHIFDDDESSNSGPVMFIPFDFVDQSKPPQTVICPPSCEAL